MNAHPPVVLLLIAALACPLPATAQRLAFPGLETGSISGRVLLSPERIPAQGVSVRLTLSTGALQATALTDAGGEYDFPRIAFGSYVISVEEIGYNTIQEIVQVGFGGDPDRVLYLTRTNAPPPGQKSVLVSAHELSIPSQARKEFEKGLHFQERADYAASLLHFQRAVELCPSYYEAYLQIGFVYRHLDETAKAETAVRKSIELSGERFAEADFTLGEMLAEKKQYSAAETVTRRGLLLKPVSWAGHYILGRILLGLNRLKEAEESARQALALNRDFAKVHLLLANIHLQTHDKASVVNDLDAYLKIDPNGSISTRAREIRDRLRHELAMQPQPLTAAAIAP